MKASCCGSSLVLVYVHELWMESVTISTVVELSVHIDLLSGNLSRSFRVVRSLS